MSDFLLGSEVSGTPRETRGGASALGSAIEALFYGQADRTANVRGTRKRDLLGRRGRGEPSIDNLVEGIEGILGRLGTETTQNVLGGLPDLGFDATSAGVPVALASLLGAPDMSILEALAPFEAEETERQVSGLRAGLGNMGARYGESALEAETDLRKGLAESFAANRAQHFLGARQQQLGALGSALETILGRGQLHLGASQLGTGAGLDVLGQILGYLRPGAPGYREGIIPGLIGAAGTVLAGKFGGD